MISLFPQDPHNTESYSKPPMLVRGQYNIWKQRTLHHLCNQNTGCWRSVVHGPYIHETIDPLDGNKMIKKDPKDYYDKDFQIFELDARAHPMLSDGVLTN